MEGPRKLWKGVGWQENAFKNVECGSVQMGVEERGYLWNRNDMSQ